MTIMKKVLIILFTCLTFLLSFSNISNAISHNKPLANNGVMDLTNWDFDKDGIVSLDGQWEFHWKEFLISDEFNNPKTIQENNFINLPRSWNKLVIDNDELSGNGYASYRLVINTSSDEILALKIPRIFTSYKLWANGDLIASAGEIATTPEKMRPQYLPQIKYLNPQGDSIELIIQVTNFRHRSGGILESIQLGTASQITEIRTKNLSLELFLFGSLFITGFYHLALFLFRTKDKSTLFFSLFCLFVSIRTLLVGEIYLIHLFPDFNWEIAHKLQTLSYYLGTLLIFLFLKSTFPDVVSRKISIIIKLITTVFAFLVVLTPARIFTVFNPIYQVFSILVVLYVLYIVILSVFKKSEGSYVIGSGILILLLFSINDIVFLSVPFADSSNHFLHSIITKGNLSSWGLLAFVFTQSLFIAKKFSKTFSKVELLSTELQEINIGLEEIVKERTLDLETSKEELKISYDAVYLSEKMLQDFMQNISHDLKTPLAAIKGYTNAILDGVAVDPKQQMEYLKRIVDKTDSLNHMVQELLDLTQLQTRQIELILVEVQLISLVHNIITKYSLDMENKGVNFGVYNSLDMDESSSTIDCLYAMVDTKKLERVFDNLLSNAIKYTSEGEHIGMHFDLIEYNQNLLIEISDTGIGIAEGDLPHIFERLYMASKSRESGIKSFGLGLSIVKQIVEHHQGKVWVESELGKGSSFFFTIPVYNKPYIKTN